MKPFNEEDTKVTSGIGATGKRVRNYLGNPGKGLIAMEDLTDIQRIALALAEMGDAFDRLETNGCSVGAANAKGIRENLALIMKLQGWRWWLIGTMAGCTAIMAFLVFLKSFFGVQP